MLTRAIAQGLMGIVPEKVTATVVLLPESNSPTTITIYNAWLKPLDMRFPTYGGVNIQGDETRIKIPDHELNPAANGREIRQNDRITIGGVAFNVKMARLMSVRTVWECLVQKEIV